MTLENYSSCGEYTTHCLKAINQEGKIIDLSKDFIGANEVFNDGSTYFEKGKDLDLICRKTYKKAYYITIKSTKSELKRTTKILF